MNRSSLYKRDGSRVIFPEGTRLIRYHANKKEANMKLNNLGIPNEDNSRSVSDQARILMSERRHKIQNRQQSMLHRAASSLGLDG